MRLGELINPLSEHFIKPVFILFSFSSHIRIPDIIVYDWIIWNYHILYIMFLLFINNW